MYQKGTTALILKLLCLLLRVTAVNIQDTEQRCQRSQNKVIKSHDDGK